MEVAGHGQSNKISLQDFSKVVQRYCGMNRFSSYQIKLVFRDSAQNIGEGPDAYENAFIKVRDFKDKFYPGRPWEAEYETKSE